MLPFGLPVFLAGGGDQLFRQQIADRSQHPPRMWEDCGLEKEMVATFGNSNFGTGY